MSLSRPSRRLGCKNVWFIILGILDILTALALSGVYFKIRAYTTSLDKVESVPTYANAIMMMCTGILTIVLFIKRENILLWPTGSLCVACLLFYATCAMLSGIQTTNTVSKILWCEHSQASLTCECQISGGGGNSTAQSKLVYEGAPNCDVIIYGLRDCMYALCALYMIGAFLALGGFVMVLLVHNQQRKQKLDVRVGNDYIELLRSSSFASNNSRTFNAPIPPMTGNTTGNPEDLSVPSYPQTITAVPVISTVPKRHRRRKKFLRQITLPGMGFCLLNQQIRLPGEENLQLLSIQRTDSDSQRPSGSDNSQRPRLITAVPPNPGDVIAESPATVSLQRTADIPPGVHTASSAPFVARGQGARVQRSISLEQGRRPPMTAFHQCHNGQFVATGRGAQVQRSISSLEQGSMSMNGLRQYFASHNRSPRPTELSRSQSDTSHMQTQRAINILRIGQGDNRDRRNRAAASPYRVQCAQRSQSDRTQDNCRHCREYRRWRRICQNYGSCLPPSSPMYPLPQHVMILNYLMSAQGRGRGLAAAFEDPSTLFEPPPPYQEEGPPPYTPSPSQERH